MKTLCFALILSQNALEENSPPSHVQELLKKRILYQIKQQNPKQDFQFDEATCQVVGEYNYVGDAFEISNSDKSLDLRLPYNDILEGKKLELTEVSKSIEVKENLLLAISPPDKYAPRIDPETARPTRTQRWLPWVIGAIGLSAGAWAAYQSLERRGKSAEARDVQIRRR